MERTVVSLWSAAKVGATTKQFCRVREEVSACTQTRSQFRMNKKNKLFMVIETKWGQLRLLDIHLTKSRFLLNILVLLWFLFYFLRSRLRLFLDILHWLSRLLIIRQRVRPSQSVGFTWKRVQTRARYAIFNDLIAIPYFVSFTS